MQIAIIAPSHVPFVVGGAEKLWWGMLEYINKHTNHQCDLIRIPSNEAGFWNLVDAYHTFYHLDLSHFDLVISGKYPSWMVKHHNHHLYMLHTVRRLYDMYMPSSNSTDIPSQDPEIVHLWDKLDEQKTTIDEVFTMVFELKRTYGNTNQKPFEPYGPLHRKIIRFFDRKAMENIKYFSAISKNVAEREDYFPPDAHVEIVYPPSNLSHFKNISYDYYFAVSRLDGPKRMDQIVEAYLKSSSTIPLKIAGTGPQYEKLAKLSKDDSRIELLGFISDDELMVCYSRAYAVIFIPKDEDYGLVTVEAMMCEKPVITFSDTGGVLEFVEDGITGIVSSPDTDELAHRIDYLSSHPAQCKRMGKEAKKRVDSITWEGMLHALLDSRESNMSEHAIFKVPESTEIIAKSWIFPNKIIISLWKKISTFW